MTSFSKKVKEQLASLETKKKCCVFTEKALSKISKESDNTGLMKEIWDKCRCDGCRTVYIRSLFIIYGSITDPEKSYHLDFSFDHPGEAEVFSSFLESEGYPFRTSKRKERTVVYTKSSTEIEDFLVYIGASAAAFDLMNSKILHEFRNSVNRQVNCDTANIGKQVAAGKRYIEAIEFLIKTGKLDSLPHELRETAEMRVKNSQSSLTDLGAMMESPVSKSGMKHRLDRILGIAAGLGFKET